MATEADYREINALINLYTYSIDDGDFETYARLFEHGELIIIDPLTGQELSYSGGDVEARVASLKRHIHVFENGSLRTKHVTTNVTIEVAPDGQSASARSYLTLIQGIPSRLPLQPIFSGRYEDQFAKRDGRWHFRQRKIYADFVGNIDLHSSTMPATTGEPRSSLE